MTSNVIVIACVMVMRSLLKKAGLWKRSIEYHVLHNVSVEVWSEEQVLNKEKDTEMQGAERSALTQEEKADGTEPVSRSSDEVKNMVDVVFQKKKG